MLFHSILSIEYCFIKLMVKNRTKKISFYPAPVQYLRLYRLHVQALQKCV